MADRYACNQLGVNQDLGHYTDKIYIHVHVNLFKDVVGIGVVS